MKKSRILVFVLVCLLICGQAFAETAYINGKTASRVHLRGAPSREAESMGLFYTGTKVQMSHSAPQDEWIQVDVGLMTGYVMNEYLQQNRPEFEWPVCYVEGGSLNLREAPSRQSKVLKVLDDAERLLIMGQTSSGWYYVQYKDGSTGYVMPKYVTLTGETVTSVNAEIFRIGDAFDGNGIYSWTAPNNQTLYFTSRDDPAIKMEDVNFDGREDVVITVIRGASNFFTEFFVWEDAQYVYARHPGEDYGLCNYQLYPEYGLIYSGINNGYAGDLHEDVLFRWEGTELKAIRRAVSEERCEMTDTPDGYSLTYDTNTLHVRVWDYSGNIYEGKLLYEALIDTDDLTTYEQHRKAFTGEQEAFWGGIK